MKRFILLLIGLYSTLTFADRQEITLVFEVKENPPYYLDNGPEINWDKPGITLSLLKDIEADLPVKFTFERVPWARALQMVKDGEADGVFHSSYKKEREAFVKYLTSEGSPDPTKQIMSQSYVIYKRKDKTLSWNGDRFSDNTIKIGAVIGYAVIDDLKALGLDVVEVTTQSSGLEMLYRGRIDAWIDIETMSDTRISKSPHIEAMIEKLNKPFMQRPYYLMFSHQFYDAHSALALDIWDAIEAQHSAKASLQLSKNTNSSNYEKVGMTRP